MSEGKVVASVTRWGRRRARTQNINQRRLRSASGGHDEQTRMRTPGRGTCTDVTLIGHQPSAEPFYDIADLAMLSSLSERSPNALLQAMAAGVPVVATAVGAIPEIVQDGKSALVVQPSDLDGISAATARLLIDEPSLGCSLPNAARPSPAGRHTREGRVRMLIGSTGVWRVTGRMMS